MRGSDQRSGTLSSYVDPKAWVRPSHPLRTIRQLTDVAVPKKQRGLRRSISVLSLCQGSWAGAWQQAKPHD